MNMHMEITESIGRLSLALLLGSVIGFERQWHQKIAGLRTNALVALPNNSRGLISKMIQKRGLL